MKYSSSKGRLTSDEQYEFFEEYKRLDAFCKDICGASEGVKAYLSAMQHTPFPYPARVRGWKEDYEKLKRFRYIRNQIAHESNPDVGTLMELENLVAFYQRFLSGDDPLSRLEAVKREEAERKSKESKTRRTILAEEQKNRDPLPEQATKSEENRPFFEKIRSFFHSLFH